MISCVRTLCHETADAGLAIDPPRREAWLIDLPDDPQFVSPICARHADMMSVPAGWLLHDERNGASALFAKRCIAKREVAERAGAQRVAADRGDAGSQVGDDEATVTRLDHRRARLQRVLEEPRLFEAERRGAHSLDRVIPDDRSAASATVDETTPHSDDVDAGRHEPDVSDDSAAATKENVGAEWIGDPDDRHNDLLDVDGSTPLLARAFRSSQAS